MHIAYFAGLFDGEGYVGVVFRSEDNMSNLRATIVNNNKAVLELCRKRFGGHLQSPMPTKQAWTWIVTSETAKTFLREIERHVVIKQPQVKVALEYPIGKWGKRVDSAIHEKRRKIKFRLMELKREVNITQYDLSLHRHILEEREDVKRAVSLYKAGQTQETVAKALNVPYATISYWLRCVGVNKPRTEAGKLAGLKRVDSVFKRAESLKARELYLADLPISVIARQLGRKPATVNYWLRRQGVTRKLSESQKLRRQREQAR